MANNDKPVDITATRDGARTRVRMVFPVQTDAGHRGSGTGRPVPAKFVQTVTVERGGAPVFVAHLGPNMARLPEVTFDLEGIGLGEELRVVWTDNAGKERKQVFVVLNK